MKEPIYCDGVHIGFIESDSYGRFVGYDLEGNKRTTGRSRPGVYRELRTIATDKGLLTRVRKGVYKRADQATK